MQTKKSHSETSRSLKVRENNDTLMYVNVRLMELISLG